MIALDSIASGMLASPCPYSTAGTCPVRRSRRLFPPPNFPRRLTLRFSAMAGNYLEIDAVAAPFVLLETRYCGKTTATDKPALLRFAVKNDRFHLGHLLNRVFRPFLAEAALFQAAVRHQIGPPHRSPVNMQVAGINLAGKSQRRINVLCEQARTQAIPRLIGELDRFFQARCFRDADCRAEQLVARDLHRWLYVSHERRAIHRAGP